MKLPLYKVINAYTVFKLYEKMHVPFKFSYFVAKNMNHMQVEMLKFEEARKELQDKYFTKTPDGKVEATPENEEKANVELQIIVNTEVEINTHMIIPENLMGIEPALTPDNTQAILWLIDEGQGIVKE
jgi:hypothetical protein